MVKLLVVFLLLSILPARGEVVSFIRDDVYDNYKKFVNGRDIHKIYQFNSEFIRRDVVDMVILQQALKLGGADLVFEFVPGKINFRNTSMLQKGRALVGFDTFWYSNAKDMAQDVFISAPVILKGEYLAGVFANADNKKVFTISKLEDFAKLTAVSTPKWHADWKTLSALPLKKLYKEDEWVSQARMVYEGFVDFFMMPLNAADEKLQYTMLNIKLKRVPNIALLLDDSRHFIVSKNHPLGKQTYDALQIGLEKLRTQGRLVKAYRESGFLVEESNYNVINKKEP